MQFLYNENREVVAEKDYSGNIIRYIRGLGLISSDSENAKTYYHYVCDEQGSVSRIIRGEDKENGAAAQDKVSDRVLNHYEYDAFGNTISCEERVANRFRYQSGSKADTKPYTNSRPHLEKVLLKKYGRMLKVLMDWLEIQIQVRLLIGHQENLEKGYGIWDTFQKQNIQKCMKHI